MSRINLGGKVVRPPLGRNIEDLDIEGKGTNVVIHDDVQAPPKKKGKAEPKREKLPPAMEQKLRDEHAEGSTAEQLMSRWGLLEEEVAHALERNV